MTGNRMLNHQPGEVRLLKATPSRSLKAVVEVAFFTLSGNSAEVMTVKLFREVDRDLFQATS